MRGKHINQWHRIQTTEIDLNKNAQLIFDKGTKQLNGGETNGTTNGTTIFNKWYNPDVPSTDEWLNCGTSIPWNTSEQ